MTITETYAATNEPLIDLMDTLSPDDWRAPSPCEGWTAADVVRHLIQTQGQLLGMVGLPAPETPQVDADPGAAWRAHTAGMAMILDRAAGQEYDGMFGRTTLGETLDAYYLFDMIAHRWDLAQAAGKEERFTDSELDRLEQAVDGFGEHLYMEGICKPGVEPRPGADRQEILLARMGRTTPA